MSAISVAKFFSLIFIVSCVLSDIRCSSVRVGVDDDDILDKIVTEDMAKSAAAVKSANLHKRQLSPAASLQRMLDYYRSAYNRMPSFKDDDHQLLRKDIGF